MQLVIHAQLNMQSLLDSWLGQRGQRKVKYRDVPSWLRLFGHVSQFKRRIVVPL